MKRRDVLKGLAGAAALCALPRAGLAATRGFTAGRFGLMLDGVFVGFVQSASGGFARADVINERLASGLIRKHIGAPIYDDITIEFGSGMGKPLYDWIKNALALKSQRKNGAIVSLDVNNAVQSSLEFSNALISEVGFPAADAASKEPALFRLKLAPELTRTKKGDASKVTASPTKEKTLPSSSFKFSLPGLEAVAAKVSKIDALVVKQKLQVSAIGDKRDMMKEPGSLEVPNLTIVVAENAAAPLYDWHEDFVIKGNNGQDKEKTATLEYLTADLKTALFTLQFSGVGIFRIETEAEANADAIRKVRASLYCEELRFDSNTGG